MTYKTSDQKGGGLDDFLDLQEQTLAAIENLSTLAIDSVTAEERAGYAEAIKQNILVMREAIRAMRSGQNISKAVLSKTASAGGSQQILRILVVDNDPVELLFAVKALERRGHAVKGVRTSAEALTLFEENIFDRVVMECQLSGIDGIELANRMREIESAKRRDGAKIIAYTSITAAGHRQRCEKVGMNRFLNKPLPAARLVEEVEKA